MSIDVINSNPVLLRQWIDEEKEQHERYLKENPDSFIPSFEAELRDLGFDFEVPSQTKAFMPKHKGIILPIAVKYYGNARDAGKTNEQDFFLDFFHYKGLEQVVPMLLADYRLPETTRLTRWWISDDLYQIRSRRFVDDYLEIIAQSEYGDARQLIILLLGKLKEERAVPVLIGLLEDEGVRLHAICALGDYKREEFRPYFERFKDSKHPGWRRYSRDAIKKLDRQKEKESEMSETR